MQPSDVSTGRADTPTAGGETATASDPQYSEIERVDRLSAERLVMDALRSRRPVVLTDVRFWDDTSPLSPEWLKAHYGTMPLKALRSGISSPIPLGERHHARWNTVGDYLDALDSDAPPRIQATHGFLEDARDVPYLSNINLECLPEIDRRLRRMAVLGTNFLRFAPWAGQRDFARGELYMGPRGTGFGNLHFDLLRTWIVAFQCHGEKRWWILPPTESKWLYAIAYQGICHGSPFRPDTPNVREDYPDYAQARGATTILRPGDVLLVPPSWWHATLNVTTSIAINVRHLTFDALADYFGETLESNLLALLYESYRSRMLRRER
jgi:hypothetical protein